MSFGWRRRAIRILGWILGVSASCVGVAMLLLAVYLLFFDYSEQLRQNLESQLSDLTGTPASIREINLNLGTFGFEIRGIEIEAPNEDAEAASEPFLELHRIYGQLSFSELLQLRIHWTDMLVEGLTVRVRDRVEGGLAIPRARAVPSAAGTAAGALSLTAERIRFVDAILELENQSLPWKLEADNLGIELNRRRDGRYVGTLSYDAGRLRIKDFLPIDAAVEADFELLDKELFLKELVASSSFASVRARGKMSLAGSAQGRFDITAQGEPEASATAFFGLPFADRLSGDLLEFRGQLEVRPDNKVLQGTLVWPRGRFAAVPVSEWSAELFWDRTLFQLSLGRGLLSEGAARLQLDQPLPSRDHAATLELDFQQARLEHLIEDFWQRPSPLASRVSGSMSLRLYKDLDRGTEGTFQLQAARPQIEADTEWLELDAAGSFEKGALVVGQALLRTQALTATVRGRIPFSENPLLELDVTTSDLASAERLRRGLVALMQPADLERSVPWDVEGVGEASGRLTRLWPSPRFEGSFAGSNVRWAGVPIGALEGMGRFTPERLEWDRVLARRGNASVSGRGWLSLVGSSLERDYEVELLADQWPAQTIEPLAGMELEGGVSGELHVARVAELLRGEGALALDRGRVGVLGLDIAKSRLELSGRSIRFADISARRGAGLLTGQLTLDAVSGELAGALEAERFPLELPEGSEEPALLAGRVDGALELAGSLALPAVDLNVTAHALSVAGLPLGDATVSATLGAGALTLQAKVDDGSTRVSLDGHTSVGSARPFEGDVRFSGLDAAPWLRASGEDIAESVRAVFAGDAHFSVDLRALDSMEADATLTDAVFQADRFRFQNRAPVPLELREGRLRLLAPLTLDDEHDASQLTIQGNVGLAADVLDLTVAGRSGLALVQTFYPNLAMTGDLELSAHLAGTRSAPDVTGYADVRAGSLRVEGFPQALGGLEGRVVFDNRTLRIDQLKGVFGTGPIDIRGNISLDGLSPASLDLTVVGEGIRLRYPEGLVATLDADLALIGTPTEQILSGHVVFEDAAWSREYDLVSGILSDRDGRQLFDDVAQSPLLAGLRLDVTIEAPQTLRIRNSLATIDASADLELRGTVAEPVLLGRSEVERGELYFLSQRYIITGGRVDFVDPTKVEPFIDLTAETRVRSYRVELRLTGTSDRFQPELSSDPPLRTVDILRLLAGASERDILLGTEEEELAGMGVASLLTERLTQQVGRRAERLFGLDRFSINPFLIGEFANPTARVSLGKQINRDLSINYSTNLSSAQEAIILIEYTPEGPMSWVLSRDEFGDIGIDVKFRRSF